MFPQPVPFSSAFDIFARRQRKEIVKFCRKRLSPEHQTIIRMRYWRELEFKDIARALQSSENAVVQKHTRVLEAMRGELKTAGVRQFHEL